MMSIYAALFVVKSLMRVLTLSDDGFPTDSMKAMFLERLNAKATVFIEYAPLETAWVPVMGDNYYYLYCLWVLGGSKGNGYGRVLMEYCLADAKEKGKSGVCMLGSKNKRTGFPTNRLQRNLVLKLLIQPIMDMICLRFLLMEQYQSLRKMLRR